MTTEGSTYETAAGLLHTAQVAGEGARVVRAQQPRSFSPSNASFDALALLRPNECDMSKIMAVLLDPCGSHGHGKLFLDEFLQMVRCSLPPGCEKTWMCSSLFRSVALEEMTTHGRRLDLVLRMGSGYLGIENKPWAGDQGGQLFDYAEHLEQKAPGRWLLLYLCNWEPSDSSMPRAEVLYRRATGEFLRLDFATVSTWIMRCGDLSDDAYLKRFLGDLHRYVRTSINNQVLSMQNSPISALLASNESFEAALAIAVAVAEAKAERVNRLYDQLLQELRPMQLQLHWGMAQWVTKGGYFTISDNSGNAFCFEWSREGLNDLSWGLWGERSEPDDDYKRLSAVLGDGESSRLWPWWQAWPRFFQPGPNADADPATWRYLASGEFSREVATCVRRALDALRSTDPDARHAHG